MLKSMNSLELHLTANSDDERQGWATHFSNLLDAANRTDTAGLWQGIAEPDIVLRHTYFGSTAEFCDKAMKVLAELQTYKVAANQYAVLLGVVLDGVGAWYLLENTLDFTECACEFTLAKVQAQANDRLEQAADPMPPVSVGLMV